MSLRDQTNNKDFHKKLPDIVLIPIHADLKKIEERRPFPFFGGKREIFCGPKLQNIDTPERKYIRTSGRFFDIDEVISQLNEFDRKIDLVVSVLESSSTCFPKNLSKLKCPKIALIGDTHHSLYSISSIIRYVKREKFYHLFVSAQPSHLHFFYEVGFRDSALFPPLVEKFENQNKKKSGLTFIGKRWKSSHPRKSRMVQFLAKNLPRKNIPFHFYDRLPYLMWRKTLARSKMVVVSSLNGQLTPQIHQCLFAGALCFVDELSSQTFLYQFFKPGKHLVTWRNFEDLLEKIIYYYNHPVEAEAIAKSGKHQAENNFIITESRRHTISEIVFENKTFPRLLAINDKRCQQKRIESPKFFYPRVRLYENVQELHRIHESLTLISMTEKNLNPSADLADLPRLKITHAFISDNSKNEADLYFQSVGVSEQIKTTILNKTLKYHSYDIGVLETLANQTDWKFLVKSISKLLKSNSLLWIFGKLTSFEREILKREGFKPFVLSKNSAILKIKTISRKICFLFWKLGRYPFPYLTLKPSMEVVPNLNDFLRGWQAYFPFLY